MKTNLWGPIELKDNTCYKLQFGDKTLYLKKTERSVKTHEAESKEVLFNRSVATEEEIKDLEFKSFFTQEDQMMCIRQSYFPKGMLVSSIQKRALLPKESINTFVLIPSAMQLIVGTGKNEHVLLTQRSQFLPDAWFGDENGEPCYFLKTDFRHKMDTAEYSPDYIYCPLMLSNHSDEVLNLEKFILRTQHFKLYETEAGILISDTVNIKFRGNGTDSIISLSEPRRSQFGPLEVVSPSVVPYVEQLFKKSFDLIRFIY